MVSAVVVHPVKHDMQMWVARIVMADDKVLSILNAHCFHILFANRSMNWSVSRSLSSGEC